MNEENNSQLDEMEAERQNNLALKSGKEAFKRQVKKQAKKQAMKVILKIIVAAVAKMMIYLLPILIATVIISAIIVAIFEGDQEDGINSEDMNEASQALSLVEYLRQFSHSTEAPQSEDGRFYKMYGDGAGWPTIGNSDLQWKSNYTSFQCKGKVLKTDGEYTVENVAEYVEGFLSRGVTATYTNAEIDAMNIYIEKDLVDEIGGQIAERTYQYVLNETEGLNLSQQQLYALTTIRYNLGHLPIRNGYTFRTVYEEGAGLYAINSWEHNKYIWDNWWSKVGGGYAGHIPARDAAFQTYVKGVYDFTYSDAGEVFTRNYYIYYTQEQLNAFSYAPQKEITRTPENEEDIFTYQEFAPNTNFDGETVQAHGYTFPHYLQNNFSGTFGTSTIPAAGCGPTSMAMILAGLCNDMSITPVTFIANLDEYYNGDWTKYYVNGVGSLRSGICNSDFLQKYYNCKSTSETNPTKAWEAIAEGKCVIGAEKGHALAIIPLPNEYLNAGGYKFYVLDSARGHSGAFKSVIDFINSTGAEYLNTWYIIEKID